MRNMSFALTTQQILDRTKTVTRRLGWANLQPGTLIRAVKKAMGLRPGEKLEPLAVLCVVSVRREPLNMMMLAEQYGKRDCAKEGFPELNERQFVRMFCDHMGGEPNQLVTRISFRYVPGGRLNAVGRVDYRCVSVLRRRGEREEVHDP